MPMILSLTTRAVRVGVVCAAVAALLAGCTPPDPPPPPPSPSVPVISTVSPTPTPSPTPSQSQLEKDQTAAKRAVVTWYATLDKVGQDPKVPLSELDKAAAGELLEVFKGARQEYRAKGWRRVGPSTKVLNLQAGSVSTEQGKQQISVSYCVDVTGVDVVDAQGKSQVLKSRPNRISSTATVEQINGKWLPVRVRDGGNTCG